MANKLITTFQKFNNNDEYLELQHELTKDIYNVDKAKQISMLNDISLGIANSDYIVAKENCIQMHKEFLQSLEVELEDILIGSKANLSNKNLLKIIGIFETMNSLQSAIKIHIDFFLNEVTIKPIPPGETDEEFYVNYLDQVLKDILDRLKREFDKDNGRMYEGFPHRLSFASSLINTFFEQYFK